MSATIEIVPSVLDRIRRTLVGLKTPRALKVLDQNMRQLERGEASALEVIEVISRFIGFDRSHDATTQRCSQIIFRSAGNVKLIGET